MQRETLLKMQTGMKHNCKDFISVLILPFRFLLHLFVSIFMLAQESVPCFYHVGYRDQIWGGWQVPLPTEPFQCLLFLFIQSCELTIISQQLVIIKMFPTSFIVTISVSV